MPQGFTDLTSATELDALAASGAERARTALARLLDRDMVVTRTNASVVSDPAIEMIDRLEASVSARGGMLGRLGISGPPDGAAWVAFPAPCVEQLLETFRMADPRADDESVRSMVAEVANIVTGSYLSELGDAWGVELDPTPVDLDVDSAQARSDALQAATVGPANALALGCGFTSGDGCGWNLSVFLLLASHDDRAGAAGPGS